eukprot:CAMPEP_0194034480 /NCGR_PEP_ID=MMETSP0009_2-20130614/6896_1 /TAXON_ID=210454 /ORGANISM="Grammatophora oceanica, Strain CCMP 410" /LENGTH=62 /DNA_ID=CAMNT_0038675421 /DNA_START=69 /DNA_END=254 /DNA_ORIENTATION=-
MDQVSARQLVEGRASQARGHEGGRRNLLGACATSNRCRRTCPDVRRIKAPSGSKVPPYATQT